MDNDQESKDFQAENERADYMGKWPYLLWELGIDRLSSDERKSFPTLVRWWRQREEDRYRLRGDITVIMGIWVTFSTAAAIVVNHVWK